MRLELTHQGARLEHAAEQTPGQREVLHDGAALEAADREPHDPVAGRRHLGHLHLALGAHEEELGRSLPLAHRVGDGDGREDVASGSSTGDHHPKRVLSVGV